MVRESNIFMRVFITLSFGYLFISFQLVFNKSKARIFDKRKLWANMNCKGFNVLINICCMFLCWNADSYIFAIWRIYSCEELNRSFSKFWVWYTTSTHWADHISGIAVSEKWFYEGMACVWDFFCCSGGGVLMLMECACTYTIYWLNDWFTWLCLFAAYCNTSPTPSKLWS